MSPIVSKVKKYDSVEEINKKVKMIYWSKLWYFEQG